MHRLRLRRASALVATPTVIVVAALSVGATVPVTAADQPLSPARDAKVSVFVSILPQAFFVNGIGGDHVSVEVLVPPGQSPATYEPTPAQMVELNRAAVFFSIGVPFEKSFLRTLAATHQHLDIVNSARGIDRIPVAGGGGEEGHGHGALDPHVWLDPIRAKIIARNVAATLEKIDPAHAEDYGRNLETLLADLDAADGEVAKILAPVKGRTMYVFHPAYGYFAARYGLRQKAVSVGGKEPGPRSLAVLIDEARKGRAKAIFVQPQFSDATARVVAREIGARVVPLDPLAEDYIRNLEEMARKVREALGGGEVSQP